MPAMQLSPTDLVPRLIRTKTDFAAKVAVVRATRRMQAELLRMTATEPRHPVRRLDKTV